MKTVTQHLYFSEAFDKVPHQRLLQATERLEEGRVVVRKVKSMSTRKWLRRRHGETKAQCMLILVRRSTSKTAEEDETPRKRSLRNGLGCGEAAGSKEI